jgi:D-aminopeptidase
MSDDEPGIERVARGDGLVGRASERLESALETIRPAVEAIAEQLSSLKPTALRTPSTVEVEFGVRLNAEVGAVVAKTQTEGHFKITLSWTQSQI